MALEPTTESAPAERAGASEIARQREVLLRDTALAVMLERVPSWVMVLNRQRQVVYANRAVVEAGTTPTVGETLGLRVGELFGCTRSSLPPGGCGTTRYCMECGAARATVAGNRGLYAVEECRILADRGRGEEALDLRVWASPLSVGGESFTLVVAVSIADEKRREFLEKIFLHDVLNSAGAVMGMSLMVEAEGLDPATREQYIAHLPVLSRQVVRELEAHRLLVSAEAGELVPRPRPLGTLGPLREIAASWEHPILLDGRVLRIDPASEDLPLVADPALVARVLGNMVKNALEASCRGQTVTAGCRLDGDRALFRVHNEACMPEGVRLQVFQRSFSTKGRGRGLGTWSMKFLVERYLGGEVGFTSTPEEGTTFRAWIPLRPPPGIAQAGPPQATAADRPADGGGKGI